MADRTPVDRETRRALDEDAEANRALADKIEAEITGRRRTNFPVLAKPSVPPSMRTQAWDEIE